MIGNYRPIFGHWPIFVVGLGLVAVVLWTTLLGWLAMIGISSML